MAAAAAAELVVTDMINCHLKPRMLWSIVQLLSAELLPPPLEIDSILSDIRTHGLLTELHSNDADPQLVDAWRSAVDRWVEIIVSLASSSMPYRFWAGSRFIAVTCDECNSDRFQACYATWFPKLLENFQSPSAIHIIKVTCFSSLSDLFTRLACFPNLKEDGTLFARKVIQPVLQMPIEDAEEDFWDVALNLLCTLTSFFPSSLQQHYDNVEAVLTSKIMASKYDSNISMKLSRGLGMLPNVKGDENSWCLATKRVLLAINSILTDLFQGLEEEKKSSEVMKKIVPLGQDPPLPLGGQILSREASTETATTRIRELLVLRVTTLMHSCSVMLADSSFPVSIAVRSMLATVERVLQVDGSFRGSLFPLTVSMHQELRGAELQSLHLGSLDFLTAIFERLRGRVFLHGANVVRLLIEYFRRAWIPSIRIKVYSILQMLLWSMDFGIERMHLDQFQREAINNVKSNSDYLSISREVIKNAFADLTDDLELGGRSTLSNMQSSIGVDETFQQNYHTKSASVIPAEHPNGFDLSIKTSTKKSQAALGVKIAALKALNSLLTMDTDGGLVIYESWRSDVDRLVVTVAIKACDAGWANEDKFSMLADESSFADYQLATLEVLLASLLTPIQTRPPYLSQALDLFRRGRKTEPKSKIADFCGLALRIIEFRKCHWPLRPRPLVDNPPKNLSVDEGFNQR